MKIYIAGIVEKYEGGYIVMNVFSSKEKALQAGEWMVKHAETFSKYEHIIFVVDEVELDDTMAIDRFKQSVLYRLMDLADFRSLTKTEQEHIKQVIRDIKNNDNQSS